ncbi:MAG: HTH-type transcriptional activator RhaS [Luteibacter sp.]|uniref:AraC family transcriptional regulator n=1 Tax=Luteibacter sp. TaxID=1886636 RepID=UPI001381F9CD|nr:AraC family transcriptional regulator [Luteibacter sp.]KAF1008895.1 MAG: HTH-type transcriptional activator RhaS [Luteibacter sp.]
MHTTDDAESASHRDTLRSSLAALVSRFTPVDGEYPMPGMPSLTFYRISRPSEQSKDMSKVALIVAVQGSKTITAGDISFDYNPEHYLLSSISMPLAGSVREASREIPYLSLVLELDPKRVADLLASNTLPPPDEAPSSLGIGRGRVTLELLEAIWRLVKLLDTPKHIPSLAPLAEQEVIYRLLMGAQGARLRQSLIADSRSFKISRAVEWIKAHYAEPIRIDDLARHVSMSLSSLHEHFKDTTTLSPLQYQKRLRLFEARKLLVKRGNDVQVVASEVGYENPSQFHREYKRLFGATPAQDMIRLRAE